MLKIEEMTQRDLSVRDIPKITRYLNNTGLKKRIYTIFFDKPKPKVATWGELRQELELSKEEIDEIRKNSGGDFVLALKMTEGAEHLVPEEIEYTDIVKEVVDIIFDLFDEDEVYNETVELVASIYQVETEEIESLSFADFTELVKGIMASSNFPTL